MTTETAKPELIRGRWRSIKLLAAMLALVVGAQLLLLARSRLMPPGLPDPVLLTSPEQLADPVAPSRAPPRYDLTIYVFSDYQCPSCRLLHKDLEKAVSDDGRVRLVYKDWVIFGDRSRRAARLAIAAQWQGRHAAMNDVLMRGTTGFDDTSLAAQAARSGTDWQRLLVDLDAHRGDIDASLERTDREARLLNIGGTPALVMGNRLFVGRLGADQIKQAIASARRGQIVPADNGPASDINRTGG
ncbi:thioredoxin domain-containing protein [Sphingosinicellaceae bacterium]|nr:thioredoxin domain-containing protein [Sphingosinicellaceae bacterium]